ncbi:crossover junction endodeoxyribonuclease RuvC [Nitratireductor aquibiodomus]|uniref:crossover junction endodeoxyribonuclease RuvC n=1 Tax=Nitratireductor aquibiodomus TaxID=204799 RepID=UPI0019D35BE0|nr:crossover junction endodeoxyribonuclease RuvC [Nitratireductor aquibiodomus]MBN7763678.1 crossover junction endodeoxyribonuclease RuvC [Nitratireductor aquibiodomus]
MASEQERSMKLTSMGIDPSATATGLVVLRENGTATPDLLLEDEIKTGSMRGVERTRHIVERIMTTLHEVKPDRIVLEGYSLGKNPNATIPLVELGGLLRFMLVLDGFKWYDPRASELKKFVTGKGGSPKEQVMMYVLKRWGHTALSNNTADAYGLAAMGLAVSNRLPGITKEMRMVVGKLSINCN